MIDLARYVVTLKNHGVAVFGPGGSGKSVTECLLAAGASVFIGDDNPKNLDPFKTTNCQLLTPDFSNLAGCAALILGPGVPFTHPKPHAVVKAAHAMGVEIFGDIELFSRAYPTQTTIGVTGTNGKSTTTALIAHVLNACGKRAIPCGNIGNAICATTPTVDTIMVIEMSSFQIDLCPTFRPNTTVHLNLTPDHLDRHGTFENYMAIKERLFEGPGIGFCGVDDTPSHDMFERVTQNNARTTNAVSVDNTTAFASIDFTALPTLRGRHNIQNALMAADVARAYGCHDAEIQNALRTYPGLPHRQFHVRTIGAVDYINDSKATNADAADKALSTFENIFWIAGGIPKSGGIKGLEHYKQKIQHTYLIGQAAAEFAAHLSAHDMPYTLCGTLNVALETAHTDAQNFTHARNTRATILLAPACASYDQFHSFEHRGDVFCACVNQLNEQREAS
jgi:UDP-N-acetylmuramoylalanine--D-glutamate ligase